MCTQSIGIIGGDSFSLKHPNFLLVALCVSLLLTITARFLIIQRLMHANKFPQKADSDPYKLRNISIRVTSPFKACTRKSVLFLFGRNSCFIASTFRKSLIIK